MQFRPTSGMVSGSNSAMGSVVVAAQYNVLDAAFTSKYQMENWEGAVSAVPYETINFGVECKKSKIFSDRLYVRSLAPPAGADLRLYDVCDVTVATQGMQSANVNLGELWISYDVELCMPKLTATGAGTPYAIMTTSTPTNANPFNGASYSIGSVTTIAAAGNTVTLPSSLPTGLYMMMYVVYGSSASCGSYGQVFAPASQIAWVGNPSGLPFSPIGGFADSVTEATFIQGVFFTVSPSTNPVAMTVTWNGGTLPSSPTLGALYLLFIHA